MIQDTVFINFADGYVLGQHLLKITGLGDSDRQTFLSVGQLQKQVFKS